MMLQKVFKMCMHRLRNDNLKSTHSLSKLNYAMLPRHQWPYFMFLQRTVMVSI